MSDAITIQAIKTQTLAIIASLTENPKPSYTLDGQSVSWAEYLERLRGTVDWCDAKLVEGDCFELHSRGYT